MTAVDCLRQRVANARSEEVAAFERWLKSDTEETWTEWRLLSWRLERRVIALRSEERHRAQILKELAVGLGVLP
jgi:hypothetical protein